jgi:antitoxin VapB
MIPVVDRYYCLVWKRHGGGSQNLHAWAQSGRTPAERVSFAGKEVRVSKVADKVIFEPLEKEPFDIEHWRAELVAAGAKKFLPEGLLNTNWLRTTMTFLSTEMFSTATS